VPAGIRPWLRLRRPRDRRASDARLAFPHRQHVEVCDRNRRHAPGGAGKLDLDQPAFALLPHLPAPAAQAEDPRLAYALGSDLARGLVDTVPRIANWPEDDQFRDYPDTDPISTATQPALTTREGVVSAATFDRDVVPGSWMTLTGANLASATRSWTAAELADGRLPLALDEVTVRIAGKPAYLSYISPTQINAQVPEGVAPGWAQVEVFRGAASSGPVLALIATHAPGAFTREIDGRRFAIATTADGALLMMSSEPPGILWKLYGALMPTWTPPQFESILLARSVDAGSAAAASFVKSRRVITCLMITRRAMVSYLLFSRSEIRCS
jgi:uncharacterized protein (TIGR03437 family)